LPPQKHLLHSITLSVQLSQNYKLLGIPFNDTQCMLLAKRNGDIKTAEKMFHLSLSSI
jgi:hypothetical protein